MKKICLLLLVLSLTGCATTPVRLENSKQAPPDRVLAFQAPATDKTGSLIVIRDEGMVASGCFFALYINSILAARLDVAESAKFTLEPGEILLKVGMDPLGKGLCGLGHKDQWIQRETFLKPGEQKAFRMQISEDGILDISRTDL